MIVKDYLASEVCHIRTEEKFVSQTYFFGIIDNGQYLEKLHI